VKFIIAWLGIHRYKEINISFGFDTGGSIRTIQCKICGIKKIKEKEGGQMSGWEILVVVAVIYYFLNQ